MQIGGIDDACQERGRGAERLERYRGNQMVHRSTVIGIPLLDRCAEFRGRFVSKKSLHIYRRCSRVSSSRRCSAQGRGSRLNPSERRACRRESATRMSTPFCIRHIDQTDLVDMADAEGGYRVLGANIKSPAREQSRCWVLSELEPTSNSTWASF